MTAKASLQAPIDVLLTRQLSKLHLKIDRYHQHVQRGFQDDLRQTIRALYSERRETLAGQEAALTWLRKELTDRDTMLVATHATVRRLEIAEALHAATQQRAADLQERYTSQTKELSRCHQTCVALQAQLPLVQQALATQTHVLDETTADRTRLQESQTSLLAANACLTKETAQLPALLETSRWFHHFLPNIDIRALTSLPTIGHAQEIATHSLLLALFRDQFYAIDVVSDKSHRTDLRIRPERDGPTVLVEVKTYLPTSKGVLRQGRQMHEVPSRRGRQKLIDDLAQNRLRGCLAGVMVVHHNQYIPNIDDGDGDGDGDGERLVVDPEHPHIFYARLSSKHLRKTIIAAVLYAYTIWGKNRASSDYEGRIQAMTTLLSAKNEDAITALAGIGRHVDIFGKKHKMRTSEAAALGINLRSTTEAVVDDKRANKPAAVPRRKRTRDVVCMPQQTMLAAPRSG